MTRGVRDFRALVIMLGALLSVALTPDHSALAATNAEAIATQGSVNVIPNIYSPQLINRRSLILYLPPGYAKNTASKYPVLYMHDGQNLFDPSTSYIGIDWQVAQNLNTLIAQHKMQEVIVVGIYNNADRISEYAPTADAEYGGGNADRYLDFVQNTVKPYIDSHYRTLSDPANTGMLGSSLGGLLSCYAGWTRAATFGKVGCVSSSFFWNENFFMRMVEKDVRPKPELRIYLDAGGVDDGAADTLAMRDIFVRKGYVSDVNLRHVEDAHGIHNEASWRARLPIMLQFLFPPQAQ